MGVPLSSSVISVIYQVSMLEDPTDLGEGEEESEDQLNIKR